MGSPKSMHVVVVGGGPAGATAAERLALSGVQVTLLERDTTRPKTCAGAVTPAVLEEFDVPAALVERTVRCVRLIPPSGRFLDIALPRPISLVCREKLDAFLRLRAQKAGAQVLEAACSAVRPRGRHRAVEVVIRGDSRPQTLSADIVIAADGARSVVARSLGLRRSAGFVAYQERVEMGPTALRLADRIEIHFRSDISPDFYGWVFPKADHLCVGTASWTGRGRLPALLRRLKERAGIEGVKVLRREAGFLPLRSRPKLVTGPIVFVGDAGGFVSPISGEGIYYAMKSGQLAASCALQAIAKSQVPDALATYEMTWRKMFRRMTHGLALAQRIYYAEDSRRECFVGVCRHPVVQRAGFFRYLEKEGPPGLSWETVRMVLMNLFMLARFV